MTDIRNALTPAVVKAVQKAAASPDTATKPQDAAIVASNILTEVVPIVAHATNNEPWWQSRVTWGAILSIVATILGIFGLTFPAELQGQVLTAIMAAIPLVGGIVTLIGRWVAKKPLGTKP